MIIIILFIAELKLAIVIIELTVASICIFLQILTTVTFIVTAAAGVSILNLYSWFYQQYKVELAILYK